MLRLILVALVIIKSKEVFNFLRDAIVLLHPESDVVRSAVLILLVVVSFCYLIGKEG